MRSPAKLPSDIEALKRLVSERTAERDAAASELTAAKAGLLTRTIEVEKLKFELARLKRQVFGASSERIERVVAQLELKLEDLETAQSDAAPVGETTPVPDAIQPRAEASARMPRRKLPDQLPRRSERHEPASCACPRCGTQRMRKVGEDVTEILEYVPGRFEVVRHVRSAYSCAKCEAMAQAPMPALPIPRGLAGPA